MTDSDSQFYLGINHTKNTTEPCFTASAIRVNKLNSLMKTMADKAGFDGKRRLNKHSPRKTNMKHDTKTEQQQHATNSYNAITSSQKRPKRQELQYQLKRITEKHVFDSEWKHYKYVYVYRKKASVEFTKWSGH